MRAAIYARVSTPRQARERNTDQQLVGRLEHYAQQKGWVLDGRHVYLDEGYSGASLSRPGLDALRDAAAMAEFEVVLVAAPDRLARNYVHQMVLIEELEKSGCRVEFVERPMSSEPNDQLLLQIRGAVAEYERTLLSERMRRGRLAKYKAGLLLPWTHTPYGLRVDPDRPRDPSGVRPDEAKAAVALRRSSPPTSSRGRASSASLGTLGRWASARAADRGLPRGGHPAGGVPEAPSGSRTEGGGFGLSGEAASGSVPPAHGTRRSGRLHRGLLPEGSPTPPSSKKGSWWNY